MKGKGKPKVIIAGAGPVGLASALTLHRRNIPVEIVERDDRPGTHSYALALHPGTVKMLFEWGLGAYFKKGNCVKISHFVFCDRSGPQVTFDLGEIPGYEDGLLVVGQNHLEEALASPLEKACIPIHWNHRLGGVKMDASGVEVALEQLVEGMSGYAMAHLEWHVDREITHGAEYLIGADGHFSMVRRKLGIEFPKVAPTQSFAVFEFKTDFPHGNKTHIVFTEERVNVLWPLPGGYCRWGFQISDSEADAYSRDKDRLFVQVGSQGFKTLEEESLSHFISERAPWFKGSIGPFRWRMIVRFEKRLAERFGKDRTWLAGDAGHMAAPIGMQSMNVGILEGHRLGDIIADILEGKADPEALEAYGEDRIREWRSLLGLDLHLEKSGETPEIMAENIHRLLDCLPGSLKSLPAFAEMGGLRLREQALS